MPAYHFQNLLQYMLFITIFVMLMQLDKFLVSNSCKWHQICAIELYWNDVWAIVINWINERSGIKIHTWKAFRGSSKHLWKPLNTEECLEAIDDVVFPQNINVTHFENSKTSNGFKSSDFPHTFLKSQKSETLQLYSHINLKKDLVDKNR